MTVVPKTSFAVSKRRILQLCGFLIIALSLFTVAGCRNDVPGMSKAVAVDTKEPAPVEPPKEEGQKTVNISVVGDIMVHAPQLSAAYDVKTGKYSFDDVFTGVKSYLSTPDLTLGNLETTLAGPAGGYSSYPRFNSPAELLTALKNSGFDVLTNANNHSMDTGQNGVISTIRYLDEAGFRHTGTASDPAEGTKYLVIDVKGIKLGILAYTYGTNGIPVPAGKEYLVNRLDLQRVKEDIRKIRAEGAEIVLVCPHFGVEYRREPGTKEKDIVQGLFRAGADIVAGSHPHVLQPMVKRSSAANSEGMFVAYSLGNFISSQRGQYKDSGVILNLKLEKDLATGHIRLADATYIPTWVHIYREKGKRRFQVLAVGKAIRDYQQGLDKTLTAADYERLKQVWQETTSLLSGPEAPGIRHV